MGTTAYAQNMAAIHATSERIVGRFIHESRMVVEHGCSFHEASERLLPHLQGLVSPHIELARGCINAWRVFGMHLISSGNAHGAWLVLRKALDELAQSYDLPPLGVIEEARV